MPTLVIIFQWIAEILRLISGGHLFPAVTLWTLWTFFREKHQVEHSVTFIYSINYNFSYSYVVIAMAMQLHATPPPGVYKDDKFFQNRDD